MTGMTMNWSESTNGENLNAVISRAVRTEQKCGRGWLGATATVADWLGVSPQIVRMRDKGEICGPSRRPDLEERCWRFLEHIAERERAWIERLARDVEQRRNALQLTLPLEVKAHGSSGVGNPARGVARAETQLASAQKALGDFRQARALKKP